VTRGTLRSVLILGATSDIAAAIARQYAALHYDLVLAAREPGRLSKLAGELEAAHGVGIRICRVDVLEMDGHTAFIDALAPLPDITICAVGLLEPQASLIANPVRTRLMMETNYLAPALLLAEIAERMEARGSGTIVGISSVAGDRGRASNFIYGSAKAGFSTFLSGMRARLSRTPVRVITVKPGFVATRMTADLRTPAFLTAQPDEVARAIVRAVRGGRDVIYVRPLWRLVMAVVGLVPEMIFKKIRF